MWHAQGKYDHKILLSRHHRKDHLEDLGMNRTKH